MSVSRKERVTRQQHELELRLDRVAAVFDAYVSVSKPMLVMLAEIPVDAVGALMVALRKRARDRDHIPMVLKVGGEWIYGWAGTLGQHKEEHLKRRKNEARSLALSIEMYAQSLVEHPDDDSIRAQLRAAKHRLEDVEAQIETLSGQLRRIRREQDEAA
jgi:hypothetical protein